MANFHFDTDLGGIGDTCALAVLLKGEYLETIGCTAITENRGKQARYIRDMLKLSRIIDIPVAAGAEVLIDFCRFKLEYAGEQEHWPELFSPSLNLFDDEAFAFLKNSFKQHETVDSLGPFTNSALIDQKYPEC